MVHYKPVTTGKGTATDLAIVRLLPRMNAKVHLQVLGRVELLVTDLALVLPRIGLFSMFSLFLILTIKYLEWICSHQTLVFLNFLIFLFLCFFFFSFSLSICLYGCVCVCVSTGKMRLSGPERERERERSNSLWCWLVRAPNPLLIRQLNALTSLRALCWLICRNYFYSKKRKKKNERKNRRFKSTQCRRHAHH